MSKPQSQQAADEADKDMCIERLRAEFETGLAIIQERVPHTKELRFKPGIERISFECCTSDCLACAWERMKKETK